MFHLSHKMCVRVCVCIIRKAYIVVCVSKHELHTHCCEKLLIGEYILICRQMLVKQSVGSISHHEIEAFNERRRLVMFDRSIIIEYTV